MEMEVRKLNFGILPFSNRGIPEKQTRSSCLLFVGFCSFFKYAYGNMWKRYLRIGGGILLLLGAPVKSKFDGLKSG